MTTESLLNQGLRSDSGVDTHKVSLHETNQFPVCHNGTSGTLTVSSDGTVAFSPLQIDFPNPLCSCSGGTQEMMMMGTDVLGATTAGSDVRIVSSQSKELSGGRHIRTLKHYPFKCSSAQVANQITASIRCAAAWGGASKPPKIQVIINPKSGTGRAPATYKKEIQPIFDVAGVKVDVVETKYAGHAQELIASLDISNLTAIACAGGDGTMFEVVQGLMSRPDWEVAIKIPLAQLPMGSSNAMCANAGYINPVSAAHALIKCKTSPLDITSIVQPATGKRFYSFLSMTYGALANMDVGSEHLRWMGGTRAVVGGLQQIIKFQPYTAEVAVLEAQQQTTGAEEGDPSIISSSPAAPPTPLIDALSTLDLGKSLQHQQLPQGWQFLGCDPYFIFMVCNVPWLDNDMFRPASKAALNNGLLDFISSTKCSRGSALKMLMDSNKVADMPCISYRQVKAIVIRPLGEGTWITADGEALPYQPIIAEVHAGLARLVVV